MNVIIKVVMRSQILKSLHQCIHVTKRHKKRYASLHVQDRKTYIFPNTPPRSVQLPYGIKVCKTLKDFKIKNLRGGFQRRPELISQRIQSTHSYICNNKVEKSNKKIEQIQYELVVTAIKLFQSVKFETSEPMVFPYQTTGCNNELAILKKTLPLVVDIGCGDGYSLKPLLDMGLACIGVDLDLSSLHRSKLDILNTKCGDPPQPYRNESYVGKVTVEPSNLHPSKNNSCYDHSCQHLQGSSVSDVVRWDLRHGLPFQPNSFDFAISISFLQWLFYGDLNQQLNRFYVSLKSILSPGGGAILQFYPQNRHQLEKAVELAMPYFHGVVVGDYPHLDRGRKLFLLLVPFEK